MIEKIKLPEDLDIVLKKIHEKVPPCKTLQSNGKHYYPVSNIIFSATIGLLIDKIDEIIDVINDHTIA